MKKTLCRMLMVIIIPWFYMSVYGADLTNNMNSATELNKDNVFKPQPYSSQSDMAFVSVWGSKPDSKKLQGFQRAVLYNARGEVVQKVDMRTDSIYSLDKMIQKNKSKGPLFIRMYR